MSDVIINVENISKLYQLGQVGTGTLHKDLKRWWFRVTGREDPFMRIGQINDRSKKSDSDFVWALRDISFQVKEGEVMGVIGRNGAGKSTLLKILSKITTPTTGEITINGRVASLLEVGTGFHPQLTGRENIFMNGAILGMRKWEIQKKFDEIVDFAGVAAYIDTPVKRYSSGMTVRLGFAVAAHLEPDILVVDEVLAVGDAEFQKKCIGKMKDVSANHGRTVLFVSHNLGSISSLCQSGLLLHNGTTICKDDITKVLGIYSSLNTSKVSALSDVIFNGPLSSSLKFTSILINNTNPFLDSVHLKPQSDLDFVINAYSTTLLSFRVTFSLYRDGIRLFSLHDVDTYKGVSGDFKSTFFIPGSILRPGLYTVALGAYTDKNEWIWSDNICDFEIMSFFDQKVEDRDYGLINLKLLTKVNRLN
jgi:lipopolysaccharide transport system ATP-binding protein